MNRGFCEGCAKLVPVSPQSRDGKVYLVKDCPDCGPTETLVSSDAERYEKKRELDLGFKHRGCSLNCSRCSVCKTPDVVFIDITNRCNLNCPICINNTPSMGFLFEPPLEYFEKIFQHFSARSPSPYIQIFGGEPTVRKDLEEIMRLCKSYGLRARLVTNGIRLADEDYARPMLKSKALRRTPFYVAYDGDNRQMHRELRGSAEVVELKQKAIDNIARLSGGRAKVILMTLIAKGYNDGDIARLMAFCHERRDTVRAIFFIPLAHNWKDGDLAVEPERTTAEDIENGVDRAFPDETVEFVPAGLLGQLEKFNKYLGIKPQMFVGVHPNCESAYILFSDGEQYRPMNYLVKGSICDLAKTLFAAERRMERREKFLMESRFGRILATIGLRQAALKLTAMNLAFRVALRHVRIGRMFKGSGPARLWHALMLMVKFPLGFGTQNILRRHTNIQKELQLVVLPFEDKCTLETERLERCGSHFAYYDPEKDRVKSVCVCAWPIQKSEVMRKISAHYGQVSQKPDHLQGTEGDSEQRKYEELDPVSIGRCSQERDWTEPLTGRSTPAASEHPADPRSGHGAPTAEI